MKAIKCDLCKRESESIMFSVTVRPDFKGNSKYAGSYKICIFCMSLINEKLKKK